MDIIILSVDNITKTIIRSLNWPGNGETSFSSKPTPYRICEDYYLSPSSVYPKWNELFGNGHMKKVIFLPSEKVVGRFSVMIKGAGREDARNISSLGQNAYFLESVHFGHVYSSRGMFSNAVKGGDAVSVELIAPSYEVAIRQAKLLVSNLGIQRRVIGIKKENPEVQKIKMKYERILPVVAYSDLLSLSVTGVAGWLHLSRKVVKRELDRLVSERMFYSYPTLNQAAFKDLSLYMLVVPLDLSVQGSETRKRIMSSLTVSDRYLLYREDGGFMMILLYYECIGEVDSLIGEISELVGDFIVLTRFETYFNDNVTFSRYA